ncbi:CREB/ATF bZIP transcription factor-like [Acanthaster planci]|uniref:CREB/ATF bZIP transcription factor-like n=1 Tax=Acanthaster planci TaxID=133434 RepID=A0A8B7XWZ2_ACAPL|nr:CREB/ATF bZIP transcription factor-like [Acanthaster planci]
MEPVQSFLDEEWPFSAGFDELDNSQIEDNLGIESAVVTLETSSSQADFNTITLASLNSCCADRRNSNNGENLLNLDFEGGAFDSFVDLTSDTSTTSKATREEAFRSPSPMSMTASLSGSELYSSPRQSEMDEHEETDQDLLEYLLQDSGINQEEGEHHEDGAAVARELTRSRRQTALRSATSTSFRGVSNQSGPWCKTKNRNNSKNAIAARENRQKKKMYLHSLEEMNSQLSKENCQLLKESAEAKKKISALEGEVQYLRKVLFNQSALAELLKKMNQSEVRLGNGSVSSDKSQQEAFSSSSGGVCLHVNGEEASLKLCASCARQDQP